MRELGHLITQQTKILQWLLLSGVNCRKEADLVELVASLRHVKTLNHLMFLGCGTKTGGRLELHVSELLISHKSLMVIVFHLPSVIKLSTERVTSRSYEGLLSSLPGVTDIDIIIGDAERDIHQITAGLRRTGGQRLTTIILEAPSSLPSENKSVSTETMRGLGLLIREQTKNLQLLLLSRVNCRKEEDLVQLVESCRHVKTLTNLMFLDCGTKAGGSLGRHVSELRISHKSLMVIVYHDNGELVVNNCHSSSEITVRIWNCLRSFTSLNQLTISDSSLSFPPSPPKLPSVMKLSTERVTSRSYEGLLSSLPGVTDIDIIIGDAERDIYQITAGLRRTGGQRLTTIILEAPSSLPSENKSVSTERMRGLGHLIREQTKNMQWLLLSRVNCTKEEDLVELVESCRNVKTLTNLM
eukprot:XP_011662518.1 PREDICTED: uncharacterized protein LOC105437535 [Strongylocentrotus purpuratus]